MRIVATLALVVALNSFVDASDFRLDDNILILVSGPPAVSTPWGLSGKATMYRATSTQSSGNLGFTEVEGARDIACERRSAKKVNQPFDYSNGGQIPPGIYFVSYHRLDPKGNRHRLAIGDVPSGTSIIVKVDDNRITRSDIQFHEAFNDLKDYAPNLSEGCVIFANSNFTKLFPSGFLDPKSSPLAASSAILPSSTDFKGHGHVLVFVTDVADSARNKKQLELFESIRVGGKTGLNHESFVDKSESLSSVRLQWTLK